MIHLHYLRLVHAIPAVAVTPHRGNLPSFTGFLALITVTPPPRLKRNSGMPACSPKAIKSPLPTLSCPLYRISPSDSARNETWTA